jgi:hypothetical protein
MTVIWGSRYIEEFVLVSLPSYLAPGNLPYVAAETDLEVVIMTSRDSVHKFTEKPIFDRLRTLCPVRYIFIDDLITTGNYGVTLTLAYARGILDAGAEQTNTNFVFMNADFVLADGSLKTLVGKLRDGERCVMAPSLRVVSETALPPLKRAYDASTETLAMPPRSMVRLSFDNLHPTVIGKTISQNFITCQNHNQIYWQVDDDTLLGRYHLIFMLAIKPEVPMGPINSYCDYGFVPELVPSGQFTIIDDSDDFFMLEVQPASQERQFLHCGTSTPHEIANELAGWTTNEHRRFATRDVVFRSGEASARLDEVRGQARDYVEELHRLMPAQALDHVEHFYWMFGMQAWKSLKFSGTPEPWVLPPEVRVGNEPEPPQGESLTETSISPESMAGPEPEPEHPRPQPRRQITLSYLYLELINFVRMRAGQIPNVPLWHYLWLDSQLVQWWLEKINTPLQGRNLLVCEKANPLRTTLPHLAAFENTIEPDNFVNPDGELADLKGVTTTGLYDSIFVMIRRANVMQTRKILESLEPMAKPGGSIAVFIQHENSETDPSNFSLELAQYTDEVLPRHWLGYRLDARFAGGLTKRRLRLIERSLFRHLWPSSHRRLPFLAAAVILWPAVAAMTAINNWRLHDKLESCPPYCSSALLSMTKTARSQPGAIQG